ncbi:MAG: AAA family ATPase [Defluviitaleaceae bacterium]|nr:AAA family ATPase [Defluviitaleaceae bacterium]
MKQSGFYKLSLRYIYLVKDLGGTYKDDKERPIYCCIQDKDNPQIYWAIPTSSISNRASAELGRIQRLCSLPDRDIRSAYYHIGHTNRPAIFKISNALPVTEVFLDGEYTSQGSHLVLRDKKLISEIERKLSRILFDESRHPNKYEQHISSIYSYLNGDTTIHSLTARGIIVNGASGTGKTTLGRELAKQLGFPHLDLDDYYYPPQDEVGSFRFAELRPRDEIIEHLKNDLAKHPHFVMSGTIGSILWDFVNPLFNLAVLLSVPTQIRLERVKARAFERYGERVLEGGDLHNSHQEFYNYIQQYEIDYHSVSLQRHEQWAKEISCPVLRVDGTRPIIENAMLIAKQYQSMQYSD